GRQNGIKQGELASRERRALGVVRLERRRQDVAPRFDQCLYFPNRRQSKCSWIGIRQNLSVGKTAQADRLCFFIAAAENQSVRQCLRSGVERRLCIHRIV